VEDVLNYFESIHCKEENDEDYEEAEEVK